MDKEIKWKLNMEKIVPIEKKKNCTNRKEEKITIMDVLKES